MAVIEVSGLTKDYGTVVAVRGLSFEVGAGEVVGFLGPNGAGKTTTLRMLAGFLGPTAGSVRVAGHDMTRAPLRARRQLGYLPEGSPLYPELRVGEYLRFRAELKGVGFRKARAAAESAMEKVAISDMERTLIQHLSKGYRQRVGIADALLGDPPLLILDEPTAGLDPNQIRDVRALLQRLGDAHTVLLSTHILSEVEAVCERALVIHRGRLVAEDTVAGLRAQRTGRHLKLELRDPDGRATPMLAARPGVAGVEPLVVGDELTTFRVALKPAADAGEVAEDLVAACVAADLPVRRLEPDAASLEEVFAALTEDAA